MYTGFYVFSIKYRYLRMYISYSTYTTYILLFRVSFGPNRKELIIGNL